MEDSQIIERVLNGDVDAFELLIEKYEKKVFKIASCHVPYEDVEEVANEIFFKAYRFLNTLKDYSLFANWLNVIAVRICKDFWRDKFSNKEVPVSSFQNDDADSNIEDIIFSESTDASPEQIMLEKERYKMVSKAMDKLKPDERTIIIMLYIEERSIAEAAEIMNLTESNVKVIAHRTKKKLAEILQKMYK